MNKLQRKKIKNGIRFFLCALTILFIVFSFWLYIQSYTWRNVKAKTLLLPLGSSVEQLADHLYRNKVINNKYSLIFLYNIHHFFNEKILLQAGEYEFASGETLNDIVIKLSKGKVKQHSLTFPEGITTYQAISILRNNAFIKFDLHYGMSTNDCLMTEGKLLPDTYKFTRGYRASQIVEAMCKAREKFINQQWILRDYRIDKYISSAEEAVILASIVEKEAKFSKEQPIIAGVYINRLRHKMRLQADPTVIYGITNGRSSLGRNMFYSDYRHKSEYNTYLYKGLTPTPICLPGKSAILAVLHPQWNNFLYFVLTGSGYHIFAEDYKNHLKNLQKIREKK